MGSHSWFLVCWVVTLSAFQCATSRNVFHDAPLILPPTRNQSREQGLHSNIHSSGSSAARGRSFSSSTKHGLGDGVPEPQLKLSDILMSPNAKSFELNHRMDARILSKLNVSLDDLAVHDLLFRMDNQRHRHLVGVDYSQNEKEATSSASNHTIKNESLYFDLSGATYPNGLYYITIQLGDPAQTFKVSIDTGSNLLWVNCQPCDPCVTSNVQQLNPPYDRTKSKTVIPVSCDSDVCANPDITVNTEVCSKNSVSDCPYGVLYGDSSSSIGVLLNETFWLPVTSQADPIPLRMIFGCGTSQSGLFITGTTFTVFQGLDGLLGLGRGSISLVTAINRTYSTNHVDNIVSHCLGGVGGGGSLLFGSLNIPTQHVVYTPLKYDPSFYRVSIKSILVGGRSLSVPPIFYGNTRVGNTAFDSGTTYTQLPSSIYRILVNAIKIEVGLEPIFDNPVGSVGTLCFSPTPSISSDDLLKRFPTISLQFEGEGVFLNIRPSTYVYNVNYNNNNLSCTRMIPSDLIQTKILLHFLVGDLWMRDFLVIHDLKNSRIGWTPMKCSQ